MSSLSPAALLEVWERAASATPAERALFLLAAAHPERTLAELEQQRVVERDAALLKMREELFGAELRSLMPCPRCDAKTELSFLAEEVRPPVLPKSNEPLLFQAGAFTGTFRLPLSGDWLALPSAGAGRDAIRDAVASRCLLTLRRENGEPVTGPPPAEVLAALGDEIARRDNHAHTELNVTCPECDCAWSVVFDIASYLWREIDANCRRLLHQIHGLAVAYGWTESEVLRLSPARRETYLSLIANG